MTAEREPRDAHWFDEPDAALSPERGEREEKTVTGTRVVVRRRYDPARRMFENEIETGTGGGRRVYARRARSPRRLLLATRPSTKAFGGAA